MTSPHTERTRTVSTRAAIALTGASVRQLDYWARTGHLTPHGSASGSGSRRHYSFSDCRLAARLAALSKLAPERQSMARDTATALAVDGFVTVESDLGTIHVRADLSEIDTELRARWSAMFGPTDDKAENRIQRERNQ